MANFKLRIERFLSGDDWTIGKFELINNDLPVFCGFTLEPAGADTATPNLDRRIPQGIYYASFEYSPKFRRNLPVLSNEFVSKNRRILIHSGNYGEDTAGCILVGNEWVSSGKVLNSINTLNTLLAKLKMQDFIVQIINKGLV